MYLPLKCTTGNGCDRSQSRQAILGGRSLVTTTPCGTKLRPCREDRFGVWSRRYKVLDAFFDKVMEAMDVLWAWRRLFLAAARKQDRSCQVSASSVCTCQDAVSDGYSIVCCGCTTATSSGAERRYAAALERRGRRSEKTGSGCGPRKFLFGDSNGAATPHVRTGLMDRDINSN
jgi:hypothetical protein